MVNELIDIETGLKGVRYVVLGANRNFLGWVYGYTALKRTPDADAQNNLNQGGGQRSTYGEPVYWIINTETEKWIPINADEIPEEWRRFS